MKVENKKVEIPNKKAYHNFEIIDKYVAGICLQGSEIKNIRNSKVSFTDSYCLFQDNELFLFNVYIENSSKNNFFENNDSKRLKKLLLNKKELKKIRTKINEKGYTIVPLKIFINENGYAKVEIATAKGKKLYEKRNSIKEKDLKRENDRMF